MSEPFDFRSDTVTKPSPAMRKAMADAEVGDDVLGEDPSVNRLEARAAELLSKPAAVFVPTGTMGNQAAIKAHTNPGEEIVCDDRAHIVLYEMGMPAQFSGCLIRAVETQHGLLSWADIQPRLRPASDHFRGTTLIEVENTHNMAGGRVYPLELLAEIGEKAHARGVNVHMDGARVFNAATALGVPVAQVVESVDSVSFCLSKGLGAPVGSVVVGEADFIERVRLVRKALGRRHAASGSDRRRRTRRARRDAAAAARRSRERSIHRRRAGEHGQARSREPRARDEHPVLPHDRRAERRRVPRASCGGEACSSAATPTASAWCSIGTWIACVRARRSKPSKARCGRVRRCEYF